MKLLVLWKIHNKWLTNFEAYKQANFHQFIYVEKKMMCDNDILKR